MTFRYMIVSLSLLLYFPVTSLDIVIYIKCPLAIVYRTIPLSIKDMLY